MLFCNKTFQGNLCPSKFEGISHRILRRCKRLPLAIVAISGVLATKDQSRIDEWEMLYHSLGAELEGNHKLESERAKHYNNNLQIGLKEAGEGPPPIDPKHLG
ncbi:hypothetical protein ACSBR2_014147 [Camellia fascicularis]